MQKDQGKNPGQRPAVIFDMDGVIFDTEQLYIACCKAVSEKFHMGTEEEVDISSYKGIVIFGRFSI